MRSRSLLLLAYAAGLAQGAAAQTSDLLLDPENEAWRETAPDSFRVRFETSRGDVVVEVHRAWAPHGADRFYNLVRHGFYDDQRFFRVVEGFIAQFGLSGSPAVTAVWSERTIPDDPVRQSNLRGYLAYAMTGPDTRTTQVYVNYGDNSRLDEQGFAPFGRVVEGMEAVDHLYAGYGENAGGGLRRGDQSRIRAEGNAHLDREFPALDRIVRAFVEGR
jgi:cyclophilin family peptidyl-prolyl cis-trans isomerase